MTGKNTGPKRKARPYAKCSKCGRSRRLWNDGTLSWHASAVHPTGCPGVGLAPAVTR